MGVTPQAAPKAGSAHLELDCVEAQPSDALKCGIGAAHRCCPLHLFDAQPIQGMRGQGGRQIGAVAAGGALDIVVNWG